MFQRSAIGVDIEPIFHKPFVVVVGRGIAVAAVADQGYQRSLEPRSSRIMLAAIQQRPKKFVPVDPPTRRNCPRSDSTCIAAIEAASGISDHVVDDARNELNGSTRGRPIPSDGQRQPRDRSPRGPEPCERGRKRPVPAGVGTLGLGQPAHGLRSQVPASGHADPTSIGLAMRGRRRWRLDAVPRAGRRLCPSFTIASTGLNLGYLRR